MDGENTRFQPNRTFYKLTDSSAVHRLSEQDETHSFRHSREQFLVTDYNKDLNSVCQLLFLVFALSAHDKIQNK